MDATQQMIRGLFIPYMPPALLDQAVGRAHFQYERCASNDYPLPKTLEDYLGLFLDEMDIQWGQVRIALGASKVDMEWASIHLLIFHEYSEVAKVLMVSHGIVPSPYWVRMIGA